MTLGNKIKAKRLQLSLSQQELADRINIKRQTIHKYETGLVTNLPLDRVQALADALEVSPAYLMGWNEKKPADSEWNSELERQNLELFRALPPEQQQEALRYQRFLLAQSESD